jgi:hypothetical protein
MREASRRKVGRAGKKFQQELLAALGNPSNAF